MSKILIIGATSTIAEHCARIWVNRFPEGVDIVLVGRDETRLEQIAQDLKIRGRSVRVHSQVSGFIAVNDVQESVEKAVALLGYIDIALVAHGNLPDQSACQSDLEKVQHALDVNAVSPVLFAEAIARVLERQQIGVLGVIGSVAGDRGRKSNYVYGSAKALVATYLQGLQHRFSGTSVKIVQIKPGPTDTPMTAHLKGGKMALADPAAVAEQIVAGMAAGKPVVYAPFKWAIIMWVIRHLPARIFNRLNL